MRRPAHRRSWTKPGIAGFTTPGVFRYDRPGRDSWAEPGRAGFARSSALSDGITNPMLAVQAQWSGATREPQVPLAQRPARPTFVNQAGETGFTTAGSGAVTDLPRFIDTPSGASGTGVRGPPGQHGAGAARGGATEPAGEVMGARRRFPDVTTHEPAARLSLTASIVLFGLRLKHCSPADTRGQDRPRRTGPQPASQARPASPHGGSESFHGQSGRGTTTPDTVTTAGVSSRRRPVRRRPSRTERVRHDGGGHRSPPPASPHSGSRCGTTVLGESERETAAGIRDGRSHRNRRPNFLHATLTALCDFSLL